MKHKPVSVSLRRGKRATDRPPDNLQTRILTIRGQKVILDADLAAIYGVTTKRLNEQVKRNAKRFPADFMFQLTRDEFFGIRSQFVTGSAQAFDRNRPENLRPQIATLNSHDHEALASNRSQFATGSKRHHDPRFLPYAFTENGAVMAANVLNSPEAVRMSVHVVRAFIQMRALLAGSTELAVELRKLEAKLTARLDTHEAAITDVLQRIMLLLDPPPGPDTTKEMGFHTTIAKPAKS